MLRTNAEKRRDRILRLEAELEKSRDVIATRGRRRRITIELADLRKAAAVDAVQTREKTRPSNGST